jgi:putative restriction endonuclease
MTQGTDPDWPIRLAAFQALAATTRELGPILPWSAIERGFVHRGQSFRFANQSKGIFRPAGMVSAALSIKTTVPRRGSARYDDLATDGGFSYSLQERGVEYHDNKLLLLAEEMRTPVIYFYGVEPGFYRPIWPAYVTEFNDALHCVTVVVAATGELYEPGQHIADAAMTKLVRRYATVETKKRLHQDLFRYIVLGAY